MHLCSCHACLHTHKHSPPSTPLTTTAACAWQHYAALGGTSACDEAAPRPGTRPVCLSTCVQEEYLASMATRPAKSKDLAVAFNPAVPCPSSFLPFWARPFLWAPRISVTVRRLACHGEICSIFTWIWRRAMSNADWQASLVHVLHAVAVEKPSSSTVRSLSGLLARQLLPFSAVAPLFPPSSAEIDRQGPRSLR